MLLLEHNGTNTIAAWGSGGDEVDGEADLGSRSHSSIDCDNGDSSIYRSRCVFSVAGTRSQVAVAASGGCGGTFYGFNWMHVLGKSSSSLSLSNLAHALPMTGLQTGDEVHSAEDAKGR